MHNIPIQLISQAEVENKGFIACGMFEGDSFTLLVNDGERDLGILSMAYQVEPRKFKTLDAIYRQAQKLGFKKVTVDLSDRSI